MSGRAASATQAVPSASTGTDRPVRTDIQGLRALAVAVVVTYHLVPPALPGGFVGVDVFFVLSGFLITLHLVERVPRRGRDLAAFWARRIRRLLPASLVVLSSTLVLSRLLAPSTQWDRTASDVRAATLYWINWSLARDSVDYLAAEQAASPVQHFWSLAVEEQFYLLWPLLVLALVARVHGRTLHLVLAVGITSVVAGSFIISAVLTRDNPAAAYFVTTTRVWELAVGGLLAVVVHGRQRRGAPGTWTLATRTVVTWGGLLAIGVACTTYSDATPFPGIAAALPVLGTAAVVAAQPSVADGRWSPGACLASRPLQRLGDLSYSVYLWHWPLVVLLAPGPAQPLGPVRVVLVLVLTLALAAATKRWVEDPWRHPRGARPTPTALGAGAVGMVAVLALSSLQTWEVRADATKARAKLDSALADAGPCFGAAALAAPTGRCETVSLTEVVPPPAQAALDKSDAYDDQGDGHNCFAAPPRFQIRECTYGTDDPDARTVVLLGNSHAGQWLPALQRLARAHDLRITTYVASQCAAVEVLQEFPQDGASEACRRWATEAIRRTAESEPAAVVYTNRVSVPLQGESLDQSYAQHVPAVRAALQRLSAAAVPVLVLRDTPAPGASVPDCLASAQDVSDCDGPRNAWLPPEPAEEAVLEANNPDVRFADLVPLICPASTCRAVNGGVVTYFDGSHLTATYAATLAPYLWHDLRQLVDRGAP